MTHKASRRQRSKTLVVMLLPTLILISIMGLVLYLIDNQYGRPIKKTSSRIKPTKGDVVTFVPALYEEKVEVMSR